MNKEQYLSALRKELHVNKVEDIEEIITEYEEHFANKLSDGYAEEEIAAKLVKPAIIAKQFVLDPGRAKGANVLTKIGAVLLDTIMILLDATLYAFTAALGAGALGLFFGALYLVFGGGVAVAPMPAMGRVVIGIATIALSVMTGAGTIYYTAFINQLNRSYVRWHKNLMTGRTSPGYSTAPRLTGKLKRRLRVITLVSLLVFIVAFAAGYVYLTVSAGALGFWHAWHWFQ